MNQNSYRMGGFTPAFALITVGLGLASTSCFGDDSSDRVIGQAPIPQDYVVVDDFETASAPGAAPSIASAPFSGGWYVFDDGSLPIPEGGMAPEGKQVVAAQALDAPHDTFPGQDANHKASAGALHISGGPYPGPWGAGVTGQLNADATFDASAYSGIMFWAKKGANSEQSAVTVSIPTINDTYQEGGTTCQNPATPGKNDGCSDGFHVAIALRQSWTLYLVYFSDLAQQGYGYKPPGGFDKKHTLAINFGNKQGSVFDEWIDDLAFFK